MSGSIIRDSFWLGIPIYFIFENLFLQICTSAWYKTVISKKHFSSRMAEALRAKRGEWGLSRKAWDEDHLTLCVGLSRFVRNITPPGLAHKAPVKAGAFYWSFFSFERVVYKLHREFFALSVFPGRGTCTPLFCLDGYAPLSSAWFSGSWTGILYKNVKVGYELSTSVVPTIFYQKIQLHDVH